MYLLCFMEEFYQLYTVYIITVLLDDKKIKLYLSPAVFRQFYFDNLGAIFSFFVKRCGAAQWCAAAHKTDSAWDESLLPLILDSL